MKKQYILYIIFAIICTLLNIGSQWLMQFLLEDIEIFNLGLYYDKEFAFKLYDVIKIIIGTAIGFFVKFLLDKLIVFKDKHKSKTHTAKQVIIYGSFAVFTTLIFWSFQILFKFIFIFSYSEYIGAAIGLAIGYTIKFFLDRAFVFKKAIA